MSANLRGTERSVDGDGPCCERTTMRLSPDRMMKRGHDVESAASDPEVVDSHGALCRNRGDGV